MNHVPIDHDAYKAIPKDSNLRSKNITLVTDHFHSEMNLAHVFRLSDALRIKEIIVIDIQEPHWRKLEKISRSTLKSTPYRYCTLEDFLREKIEGEIIGLEWTKDSKSVFDIQWNIRPCTIILGNESHGISPQLLEICKECIHLPMLGTNSSMNVSMAASVALFQLIHGQN